MIYALDTMVVSEPRKPRPHEGLLAWLRDQPTESLAIPAFVFLELQEGVERMRQQDQERAKQIESWIDRAAAQFTVLPFTSEAAREAARLLRNQSHDLFEDACIAATAKVHGLTVATRNTSHFKLFHVAVVNPFLYGRQANP